MKKHIPVVILIIILAIIIFFMAKIVITNYEKNRPINPDISLENLNDNDLNKIKAKYESEKIKEEFLNLCNEIELAVTNRLLDGTVTNDEELKEAINEINNILKTTNWDDLGLPYPSYWMGTWKLNEEGKLEFNFKYKEIIPSWTKDIEVTKYIK